MQTFSGVEFYPLDPRPEEIIFDDIAEALSKQCRYAGHCLRFYSVAEHCVHVAESAPHHLKLAGLMHDSSEAYLVDVPRPVKPFLREYREHEHRLMVTISERFNFVWPMPPQLVDIDNRILHDERQQNMVRPPRDWGVPGDPLGVTLQFWSPAEARARFTEAFYRYGGE